MELFNLLQNCHHIIREISTHNKAPSPPPPPWHTACNRTVWIETKLRQDGLSLENPGVLQTAQAQGVQHHAHHSVNLHGVSAALQARGKTDGACSSRALILPGEMAERKSQQTNKMHLIGFSLPFSSKMAPMRPSFVNFPPEGSPSAHKAEQHLPLSTSATWGSASPYCPPAPLPDAGTRGRGSKGQVDA